MSKDNVEKLLMAGGTNKELRLRYNTVESKEEFVQLAAQEGYEFSVTELDEVLKEEGLTFESYGNPRTRDVWIR